MLTATKHIGSKENQTSDLERKPVESNSVFAPKQNSWNASPFDFSQIPLQPKLKINTPGDRYEQEADRIADKVVSMNEVGAIEKGGNSQIQRKSLLHKNNLGVGQHLMTFGKSKTSIQPKLTVNRPGDIYEQEAYAMADRVMRMSSNETEKPVTGLIGKSLQRKCAHCKEEEQKEKPIMRKAENNNAGMPVSSSFAASLNATKGGGSPLPHGTKSFMENAFSADFSKVRVHSDNQASKMSNGINAKAFTYGNHIYFGEGQYNSTSSEGKHLLAHELTHVVQNEKNKSIINREVDAGVPPPAARPAQSAISEELKIIWYDNKKSVFFQRLRNITPEQYNDEDTFTLINNILSGDEQWWAGELLAWGTEAQWPIESRIQLEFKNLPPSRGNAGVIALLKGATPGEKVSVVRFMLPSLKSIMGDVDFKIMLTDLKITELIETINEGEKKQILTDSALMQLLQKELSNDESKIVTSQSEIYMWRKLVREGLDTTDADIKEKKFIDALKLIGYDNVNIARGGKANPKRLKAGLNLDIEYTNNAAESGYLRNDTFDAEFPLDYPDAELAEIIGISPFLRDNPVRAIMTIGHELEHTEHHKKLLEIYKLWKPEEETEVYKSKLLKNSEPLIKLAKKGSIDSDELARKLKQLKLHLINEWVYKQKKISGFDKELFEEGTSTLTSHPKSEVLAGLVGFMKGFHLIPLKNQKGGKEFFDELTYYPAVKGYWPSMGKNTKAEYISLLTNYYCNTLSVEYQDAFDITVKEFSGYTSSASAKDYYALLANIKCT